VAAIASADVTAAVPRTNDSGTALLEFARLPRTFTVVVSGGQANGRTAWYPHPRSSSHGGPNMCRLGLSETVVMAMAGHRTQSVHTCYDIISDGDLLEAAAHLAGEIPGGDDQLRSSLSVMTGPGDASKDPITH
jgi:hypothetical protein